MRLWLAVAALIALAFAIAYFGAGQFKNVVVDTVTAGSGPLVTEMDGVIIEYTGRTEDGTVFDSTEGRGPAPFLVMQVVPGFREALTKMQQGGRYKIVIPGRLAYGPNPPAGSPIGPNEDLSFDVHVLQVAPNAALSAGAGPQGQ
ncbi:FKBP-type peptidyl-prolyl cis-trans isomerase [Sphingomonas sp. NSE70-1]|uniref:Peptidyl-prolyl cis-trans isomerase n=1 Tax=Sphingomonas caseinilyticus TaxID=2908205 RepID=A0ABT0RUD5_9SPHN|nr:FKBP-type peptidyl-prolyl cis-trans isomerase [Sphingomonas caseinilyticus]MCL6698637.1 FKBP-type peptidyl-prolyl cis-trans isomerase [Sphingomonas caseinilyticus]